MGQQQNGEQQRDQRYRGDTKFHRKTTSKNSPA
jgi:hypothetical protein